MDARAKIIEILKKNNWYAVVFYGHWATKFIIKQCYIDENIRHEIYSAIVEEYFIRYSIDPTIIEINLNEGSTFESVLIDIELNMPLINKTNNVLI